MRKSILLITGLFIIFLLSGCTTKQNSDLASIPDHATVPITVGDSRLNVEVVNSLESITQGLGDRTEIGSDGMLFVLLERDRAHFWMKGMQFGLDMVWIDGTTVIGTTEKIEYLAGAEQNLKIYSSPAEVDQVLELPYGDVAKRGIKAGDQVTILSE